MMHLVHPLAQLELVLLLNKNFSSFPIRLTIFKAEFFYVETGESFKTQLQTYTDEKFWEIPVYVHECLTVDNSSGFKAPVNVEIQTSECQNDAERDVAGLATAIFANLEVETPNFN